MELFRGETRKPFAQVETHLVTENGLRPRPRAVAFFGPVALYAPKKIKVLLHLRTFLGEHFLSKLAIDFEFRDNVDEHPPFPKSDAVVSPCYFNG